MKTASIVKIPNKGYIIFGESKTTNGLRIASGPYFNISESEASSELLVNKIKAALINDDSQRVPTPQDWKQFDKEFLKHIGLKSIKELDNPLNKNVSVKDDGTHIIFVPSRPAEKPDKGFLHKGKIESIEINTNSSTVELMKAYELALSKCS